MQITQHFHHLCHCISYVWYRICSFFYLFFRTLFSSTKNTTLWTKKLVTSIKLLGSTYRFLGLVIICVRVSLMKNNSKLLDVRNFWTYWIQWTNIYWLPFASCNDLFYSELKWMTVWFFKETNWFLDFWNNTVSITI